MLAAPTAAATGDAVVGDRQRRLLERHGQRQPGPLRAETGDQAGQLRLGALDRVYDQPVSPAAANPALWITGDSECAIGLPQHRGTSRSDVSGTPFLPASASFVRWCSASVVANAEWPSLSMATK